MKQSPLISVIMITYNHEKYIREAVESILSQSYSNFELIIVDDGSLDKTFEIIQNYTDPRILLISQENSGPSVALNAGIEKCRGEFVAFMSGDDVSLPNRLATQLEQIQTLQADILFGRPQIIGPNSQILPNQVCPWFFQEGTWFNDEVDLYKLLFFNGNFLCASSVFCRLTAIEKVGKFKKGLIQLQDFDYWIRSCKKNLSIKFTWVPLIQYRFLWGANLSDRRNEQRVDIESKAIYRTFFDDLSADFLRDVFGEITPLTENNKDIDFEIYKSMLFLKHSNPGIRQIGIEHIISLYEDASAYSKLSSQLGLDLPSFFKLTQSTYEKIESFQSKLRNVVYNFQHSIMRFLGFLVLDVPQWTEEQVKLKVEYYLAQGDYKRAMLVVRGYRKFPPGPTILVTIYGVANKLSCKLYNKTRRVILRKSRTLKNFPSRIVNTLSRFFGGVGAVSNLPDLQGVFNLKSMYEYGQEMNCIVHEEPLERYFIEKPNIFGVSPPGLYEGEICAPRSYVSDLKNVIITGESSLVLTRSRHLLSDQMVKFSSKEFGVKSHDVKFRQGSYAILNYKRKKNTSIREGILLSSDYDKSYFHWLVESLPKLVFIDSLPEFEDLPLLIPQGMHENLINALCRVNKNARRVIELESGVAHRIDRLIFPSALSNIIDRYEGSPVYTEDVVLSHKWISETIKFLRKKTKKQTWRKIYLTRGKELYRKLGNKQDIEKIFHNHGFEIIDLSGLTFNDQVLLFSQASVVAGPTGAAMTNILLCKPGTKFTIFMSDHQSTNHYVWKSLGDIAGVNVNFIAGKRLYKVTSRYAIHDDYIVDPKLVLKAIYSMIKT